MCFELMPRRVEQIATEICSKPGCSEKQKNEAIRILVEDDIDRCFPVYYPSSQNRPLTGQ